MTCVDIQRRPCVDLAKPKERERERERSYSLEYAQRSSTRYCYRLPALPSRERRGPISKDLGQSVSYEKPRGLDKLLRAR